MQSGQCLHGSQARPCQARPTRRVSLACTCAGKYGGTECSVPEGVHRADASVLQESPELVPTGQQGGRAEGRCDEQHDGQDDGAHLQAEGLSHGVDHLQHARPGNLLATLARAC